jgi:hypothetical protein
VGEDCRQDDCERIWINNQSTIGDRIYKVSVRIATYHAEINQNEPPNYTVVTDFFYRVSCSEGAAYTQGDGEERHRYPEYRDDQRYDQSSELRDDIWKAVCEGKYAERSHRTSLHTMLGGI